MKFVGIGNDIVEISRIHKAIQKEAFVKKVFTEKEIALFLSKNSKTEFFAGRFSAKEAISKGLGTGVRNFSLTDIEILSSPIGKPIVTFKNNISHLNEKYLVDISISHSKEYATAVAIIFEK